MLKGGIKESTSVHYFIENANKNYGFINFLNISFQLATLVTKSFDFFGGDKNS